MYPPHVGPAEGPGESSSGAVADGEASAGGSKVPPEVIIGPGGERRSVEIKVALITAAATTVAAVVAGLFAVNAGAVDIHFSDVGAEKADLEATITSLEQENGELRSANEDAQRDIEELEDQIDWTTTTTRRSTSSTTELTTPPRPVVGEERWSGTVEVDSLGPNLDYLPPPGQTGFGGDLYYGSASGVITAVERGPSKIHIWEGTEAPTPAECQDLLDPLPYDRASVIIEPAVGDTYCLYTDEGRTGIATLDRLISEGYALTVTVWEIP